MYNLLLENSVISVQFVDGDLLLEKSDIGIQFVGTDSYLIREEGG